MTNEKRLIDVNRLKGALREVIIEEKQQNNDTTFLSQIGYLLDACPTVDAVEVVHGYWDDSGRYQFPSGKKAIRCSICGCALSEGEYHLFNWNYCPVCGAKMDMEVDK